MEIEKLIEQYQKGSEYWRKNRINFPDVAASYEEAATALSTLQSENEKLRAAVNNWKKKYVETNGKWINAENKWAGLDKAVRNGTVYRPMQEELNLTHEENQSLKDANEELRGEVKRVKSLLGENGQDLWSKENQRADRLEAELELEREKHQHTQEVAWAHEAELEQVKRALAMMWFAYVNSDKEYPHSYETDALEEAERILGPWKECMPKYLRRGPEEG